MKKFSRIFAIFMATLMIFGSVAVFADEPADDLVIAPAPVETNTIFVTVEGPDGLVFIGSGEFKTDEEITAGDVLKSVIGDGHELTGIDDGYISAVDGVAAGVFGGWDGWMYAVKYYVADEEGNVSLYIDLPNVGVNDYQITSSCNIVLYYANYGTPFAGTVVTDNDMVALVSYTPVYDENYNLVEFTEAPLANGEFTLTSYTVDDEGNTVLGDSYTFAADENGLTKLHRDMREVPNGDYIGSVGKQSETTATIGEVTVSLPDAVRYTDFFTVDVHPTPEEIFRQKVFFLMLGMGSNRPR